VSLARSTTTCRCRATCRHGQRHGRHPAHRALRRLRGGRRVVAAKGATIARSLVGNYITSLDMAGASITVLRLTPDLTALWDAPVETPALRWGR
jgi:hypothetical protein